MMFDIELILMITMRDLMDQFPNFNYVQKSDIHNLKEFSRFAKIFHFKALYNAKKTSLFLSLPSESIVIGLNRFIVLNV